LVDGNVDFMLMLMGKYNMDPPILGFTIKHGKVYHISSFWVGFTPEPGL